MSWCRLICKPWPQHYPRIADESRTSYARKLVTAKGTGGVSWGGKGSTSPLKERYAVSQDNVIKLAQPGEFSDALTAVLRQGARSLLTQAVEAEIASFLETHADKLTEDGHRRLVRHGHLPDARSRLVSASSPCANRVSVTEDCNEKSASTFRRRSCHPMRAARKVSMC